MRDKPGQDSKTESLEWWNLEMVRCGEPAGEEQWHLATLELLPRLQSRGTKKGLFGQISQTCLGISRNEAPNGGPQTRDPAGVARPYLGDAQDPGVSRVSGGDWDGDDPEAREAGRSHVHSACLRTRR